MEISVHFNRFYHSILNDLFRKSNSLVFRHLKDTRTNGAFKLVKYEDYRDMDDLKQLLKLLNLNYAVDINRDEKQSTKDVNNKELLNHLEWIFKVSAENGITLDFIEQEWEFLINYYK